VNEALFYSIIKALTNDYTDKTASFMFILCDLLQPLQAHFSETDLGRERASLLAYTLLSVIVPFTSSMTSNLLRCLEILFGIEIKKKRFYTVMASTTLPWLGLWQTVWRLIPSPATEGQLLIALDDFINPKAGKNIFGCETVFDHAASQSKQLSLGTKYCINRFEKWP